MIVVKKNTERETITVTINDVSITLNIGEWSRMISNPGHPVYGLVTKAA